MGRLGAEGSPNIWQSGGSGSRPLPHRLGGARPRKRVRFGHKGAHTHGTLESGMKPVSPRAPACQPTPTDPPANVPAAGQVPRPVIVVSGNGARWQGKKSPKMAFFGRSAKNMRASEPQRCGRGPPIGCAECPHARFGPGLYLVFWPFWLERPFWGHLLVIRVSQVPEQLET